MDHMTEHRTLHRLLVRTSMRVLMPALFLLSACGTGDSGQPPNTPLTTPMALVVNQDDTSVTTLRLDGKGSPVIGTLSLGPAQSDAIGGVTFSIGEWIFVTHSAGNRVAFIDPIGALAPILEGYLDSSGDPRVGQRPGRIYRDPLDKEVLWALNEGDPAQGGVDTSLCNASQTGSYTILHNSHLKVAGIKPHVVTTQCLAAGAGEAVLAFSGPTQAFPTMPRWGFIASKTTGKIALVNNDPANGQNQYRSTAFLNLCDASVEACDPLPLSTAPNGSAPARLAWSRATGKIYAYLEGYRRLIEIDPAFSFGPGNTFPWPTGRSVDLAAAPFNFVTSLSIGVTPDGRFLFLTGADVLSDPAKVLGKFGVVDLAAPVLTLTSLAIPELDHIRPTQFQFTPDGRRLYVSQSNKISDLVFGAQVHALKKDRLLVFDSSTLPAAPQFLAEVALPAATTHGMDVWVTGPQGAGSAQGVVVTNATPGAAGSVSLIDATNHTIAATIPVGKNPKQATVYYVGLAANDNQATPTW